MTSKSAAQPVDVRQVVSPAALAAALKSADGDHSRIQFNDDGTVTVLNVGRRRDPNRRR